MTSTDASRPSGPPDAPAGTQLAHAALEAVVMVDADQRIVMMNPAGLCMFGLTQAQALGMPLERLLPERLRALHAQHVQRFAASGETERRMGQRGHLLGLRANGEEFPLEAAIFRSEVAHPDGTRVYHTALLRDLSELHRMGSVIDQLNQRLRALFERVPAPIWIIETDRVVFANPACARLLGLEHPGRLVGQSIFDHIAPASHAAVRAQLQALEHADTARVVPGALRHADGSLREVEMVVAALPDHERRFVQMVINDVTRRARERSDLLRSRRTLREFAASIVEAREEERHRIARELHDELGQRLTAMKLEMLACMRDHPSDALAERGQGMLDMLDETVASARRIAMDLRPLMLDDLGLAEAIDWQVKDFGQRTGIRADLRLPTQVFVLPQRLTTTIYRIVQEALTNVARHARADRVSITLGIDGDELQLVIEDNGIGFATGQSPRSGTSFGLLGIRERVLMVGGRLALGNAPGGGARLSVRVPLAGTGRSDAADEDARDPLGPIFDTSTRGTLD